MLKTYCQKKPEEDKLHEPLNTCHKQLESFVLFTLNTTENKDRFLLNAWLIKDNSLDDLSKYQSLLSSDEQQLGTICKFSEIQIKIDNFIKKARTELRGKRYNLVLEFFLPSNLMLTEVDRWKISSSIVEEITLGTEYPVRLRSRERLTIDYLDERWSKWCDRWDEVNAVLNDRSALVNFEHLPEMDNFNWKLLKNNLMSRIGLKVTCAPPKSKIEELFRAILTAATPIAIWTRRDLTNCDCLTAINAFLSGQLLCDLCESVRKLRAEADAHTEEHLGSHLSILWEDPHRLTPDVMVELKETGL